MSAITWSTTGQQTLPWCIPAQPGSLVLQPVNHPQRYVHTHTHTFSKRVPRAHAPTWAATHCLAEQFLTGSGIGMTLSYVAQLDNLFYFMVRMTTVHSGRDKMFSHFCRTTNLSQVKCLASQRGSGDFLHY